MTIAIPVEDQRERTVLEQILTQVQEQTKVLQEILVTLKAISGQDDNNITSFKIKATVL